jgi:protease I
MSILNFGSDSEKEFDSYAPAPIPQRLVKNKKVAIITADKTESLEFFYPFYRLTEEGFTVDVITPEGKSVKTKHDIELKKTKPIEAANPSEYELIYIPGGKAPAELRKNEKVIDFVRRFAASGKHIAAICHGPQVLISAGLVGGKQIAAYPEIKEELQEAGATFIDEALAEDGQFITSRRPGDLHRHLYGVLKCLNNDFASSSNLEDRNLNTDKKIKSL